MGRSLFYLTAGISSTALLTSATSVYLFHDVDKGMIGHWNEAFAGLCFEFLLFTLFISGGVGILTWAGRQLMHLKGYSPRTMLGLLLGIGVSAFQYPWDLISRSLIPQLAEASLGVYLVLAIIVCTVILLRDNYRQMQLSKMLEIPSSSI